MKLRYKVVFFIVAVLMICAGSSMKARGACYVLEVLEYKAPCIPLPAYLCLCRAVEAEATGGTVENKINVCSVIINRVNSKEFPNNVIDVVFQKGQFSIIDDGRYWSATKKISAETYEAVNEVLRNGVSHNCLFFCTRTCRSYKSGWFSTLKEDMSVNDSAHAFFTGEKK